MMGWFPWQGSGLTNPWVGWLAFAALWVAGYFAARRLRRYEAKDSDR